MKLVVMTGDRLRHRYLAGEIVARFPDASIVIEGFHRETGRNYTNEEVTPLMADHFEAFDRTERARFEAVVESRAAAVEDATALKVEVGEINEPDVCRRVQELGPDLVIVYSTSIIKDPLLSAFGGRMLNLHAGLSPYYRGAGTNLFPFYNDELEFVGMTVHHLDAGVDSGDMILQRQPPWSPDDNTHTIGCACVELGATMMIEVIEHAASSGGPPAGVRQELASGRVYRKKDFTDDVLRVIRQNIAEGMVERYAASPRSLPLVVCS